LPYRLTSAGDWKLEKFPHSVSSATCVTKTLFSHPKNTFLWVFSIIGSWF